MGIFLSKSLMVNVLSGTKKGIGYSAISTLLFMCYQGLKIVSATLRPVNVLSGAKNCIGYSATIALG